MAKKAKKKTKKKAAKKKTAKKGAAKAPPAPPPPPPVPMPPGMAPPAPATSAPVVTAIVTPEVPVASAAPQVPVALAAPQVPVAPPAPVAPAVPPPAQQVSLQDAQQAVELVEGPKIPSLAMFKNYIRELTGGDESPCHIFTRSQGEEIIQMVSYIEAATAEELVTQYPRLMALLGFWKNRTKAQERNAEKNLRITEATADGEVRKELVEAGGKTTEAMVTAGKLKRTDVQEARDARDRCTTMVYQFEALMKALNTDMLVQASLWTRPDKAPQTY